MIKLKKGSQMNVKKYIADNEVLINYVRDSAGFRKGVVVATKVDGTIRIGWSLVNHMDYDYYAGNLKGVPAYQRWRKSLDIKIDDAYEAAKDGADGALHDLPNAVTVLDMLTSWSIFKKIQAHELLQPRFNRTLGLEMAIGRALKNDPSEVQDLPSDTELIETVNHMIVRSEGYAWKK